MPLQTQQDRRRGSRVSSRGSILIYLPRRVLRGVRYYHTILTYTGTLVVLTCAMALPGAASLHQHRAPRPGQLTYLPTRLLRIVRD
eukprot:3493021-Rhodomonas_salina.3